MFLHSDSAPKRIHTVPTHASMLMPTGCTSCCREHGDDDPFRAGLLLRKGQILARLGELQAAMHALDASLAGGQSHMLGPQSAARISALRRSFQTALDCKDKGNALFRAGQIDGEAKAVAIDLGHLARPLPNAMLLHTCSTSWRCDCTRLAASRMASAALHVRDDAPQCKCSSPCHFHLGLLLPHSSATAVTFPRLTLQRQLSSIRTPLQQSHTMQLRSAILLLRWPSLGCTSRQLFRLWQH